MNYNKIVLVGRITKDPELRQTQTQGISFVMFTLAVNRKYSSQQQEQQADFLNCVAWDKRAEFLAKYIKKGALLLVDGRLQTRRYELNGEQRTITEVICEDVQPLEKMEQRASKESAAYESSIENSYVGYQPKKTVEDKKEEIPNSFVDEDAPF